MQYKYARLTEVFHVKDGLIHTIGVEYFNFPAKKQKRTMIDVRRLTLLSRLFDVAKEGFTMAVTAP